MIEAILGTVNALAALAAIVFAWKAFVVARQTLHLEREIRSEHAQEARLRSLDALALATHDLGHAASLLKYKNYPDETVVDARARFQIAFAANHEDLPKTKALSDEANLDQILMLFAPATVEITEKRREIAKDHG